MKDNFWALFRESVIVQALLTVALWGAVIYLVCTNQSVPEILQLGASSILGFWFGSKVSAAALKNNS